MSNGIGKAIHSLGHLYQGSDTVAAFHVLISVGWLLAYFGFFLGADISPAHGGSPLIYIPGFLVAGLLQHRLLIVHHETLHRTLFRSRALNEFVGSIAGGLVGFTMAYRKLHMAHHARLGEADDPDVGAYAAYPASRVHLLLDLLRTLTGIAALQQFWIQAFTVNREANSEEARFDRGLFVIGFCQLLLLACCAIAGAPAIYLLCWLMPLVTVAKTLTFLRNLAEHLQSPGLSGVKSMGGRLRTIRCGALERLIFAPLNFNFHGEHHLYPGIPFHRLPEAHAILSARPDYSDNISLRHSYVGVLLREASQ